MYKDKLGSTKKHFFNKANKLVWGTGVYHVSYKYLLLLLPVFKVKIKPEIGPH